MHVPPPPLPSWLPPLVLSLLVLAIWTGARRTRTGRPAILLGLALAFAATRGIGRFEYRADGWLAVAVIGLAWVLVARFARPGRFARVAGLLVLGFWAVVAHAQAGIWITERALLDHAVEADPTNWQARIARAEWAMLAGEDHMIETDALAALVAQPRSVAAAFMLGTARGLAGDEDGAQLLAAHGARTGWNDASAGRRLGYVLLELGREKEAMELLARSPEREAMPGLALAAARRGDPVQARACLERALAEEPTTDDALAALAWLLATAPEEQLRDPERALVFADRIEGPGFWSRRLDARAAALARLGRFADAYRDAQAAANQADTDGHPARANHIRERALVYLESGTWTEPRDSAPAADTRMDENGDEQHDRGRDPGDR